MLARAANAAKAAGANVEWIHSDATKFSLDRLYDGVICLCEGAFGLLGQRDDSIGDFLPSLKSGASYFNDLLLQYLDRLFPSVRGCECLHWR